MARYFVHWKTEPASGKWLEISAKLRAMMNWPAATMGHDQMKTPPMVARPRPKSVKMPVEGEM